MYMVPLPIFYTLILTPHLFFTFVEIYFYERKHFFTILRIDFCERQKLKDV